MKEDSKKKTIKKVRSTTSRAKPTGVQRSKSSRVTRSKLIPLNTSTHMRFNRNRWYLGIISLVIGVFVLNTLLITSFMKEQKPAVMVEQHKAYWFMLHRKSEKEYFYRGVPGDAKNSKLLKTFIVKVGIPGERPTPLPRLLGRDYWVITEELEQFDNPETYPYFLTLNIPVPPVEPFGPSPYTECNGQQCNWMLPGAFGLHGIASDSSRLSPENPGSSGCIRHRDEDITYLYNTLDPKKEEIRYYIEDK